MQEIACCDRPLLHFPWSARSRELWTHFVCIIHRIWTVPVSFLPADGLGSSRQDGDDSITLRIQYLCTHDPSEARSDGHEGVVVFALWLCFSIHNTWTAVSVLVNGSETVYSVILFQLGAMVMTRQESGVVPSRGMLLCRNNPGYHSFLRSGNAFASVHRHGSLWLRCSPALFCLLPYGVFGGIHIHFVLQIRPNPVSFQTQRIHPSLPLSWQPLPSTGSSFVSSTDLLLSSCALRVVSFLPPTSLFPLY
mgnify:FL=1